MTDKTCGTCERLLDVVRDMLIFLDNDEYVFCEYCTGNGEDCHGDYICATMIRVHDNFIARLKALGVEA